MAANEKTIYVYDDFSFEKPELIGTLYDALHATKLRKPDASLTKLLI